VAAGRTQAPGRTLHGLDSPYFETKAADIVIRPKEKDRWFGKEGASKGTIFTENGALKDYPYGFGSLLRKAARQQSNPRLIAAAHASC
jgi:hypothetical protein